MKTCSNALQLLDNSQVIDNKCTTFQFNYFVLFLSYIVTLSDLFLFKNLNEYRVN